MSVVMTYGATTFTAIRDPEIGNFGTVRHWKSPSIRSGGGKIFVYNKSLVKDIVTLVWKTIDMTDQTNLLAFLAAVGHSSNAFDFTDPIGDGYEARFIGPQSIKWTPLEITAQEFTVELLLLAHYDYLCDSPGTNLADASGNRFRASTLF